MVARALDSIAEQAPQTSERKSEESVRRTIRAIRSDLGQAFSLDDLADIAGMSPFHFCRVFARFTGITPGKFVNAVKIEHAKRRLFAGQDKIISICYDLGYSSLGSFTSTFNHWVGFSPSSYRRLSQELGDAELRPAGMLPKMGGAASVSGLVLSAPAGAMVAIGAFASDLPRGRPACSTISIGGSPYRMGGCEKGAYRIFAVATVLNGWRLRDIMEPDGAVYVGGSVERLELSPRHEVDGVDIRLRELTELDPPILFAYALDLALRHMGR
jgi:AraC-like DNA-binding protein